MPQSPLTSFFRIIYSPTTALTELRAPPWPSLLHVLSAVLIVVAVFARIAVFHDESEDLEEYVLVLQSAIFIAGYFAALLIFGLVASLVSRQLIGRDGDYKATIVLSFPGFAWFVFITTLLSILVFGSFGTDPPWTIGLVYASSLLVLVLWLLWVESTAVSVANHTSLSDGLKACVAGVIASIVILAIIGAALGFRLLILF